MNQFFYPKQTILPFKNSKQKLILFLHKKNSAAK